ncbi:hypothetical protein [Candidatus Parabeggiatoa sp. HSG14]|uniref:hypothetical protein n=1 Tax=Candidatus Parabeggiatoa sp. HSG14 TaxID=3055593 RepID=UPI0025A90E62|nr:hypothetical protein [Thiotrichales bacterium HSG14]
METIESPTEISTVPLLFKMPVPLNTELPPTAQNAFEIYLQQHPEMVTQILTLSTQISQPKPQEPPNKWTQIAQEFRDNAMSIS